MNHERATKLRALLDPASGASDGERATARRLLEEAGLSADAPASETSRAAGGFDEKAAAAAFLFAVAVARTVWAVRHRR